MRVFSQQIKQMVPMRECLRFYLGEPNRQGFYSCPFHQEDTPSAKEMPQNNLFHCFGCGESVDVIGLVMRLFSLSFYGAMQKLNDDFALCLPIGKPPTLALYRDAQKQRREQKQARARQLRENEEWEDIYWCLWGKWIECDKIVREYHPQTPDDEPHPYYLQALHALDYISYLIDCLPEKPGP